MKVCCLQLNIVWQNETANLANLTRLFESFSSGNKPDVVVLPELFHSGFSMQTAYIKQTRSGLVYQTLSQLAKVYSVYLIAGVALQSDATKALNSALVFDQTGTEQACYIKNYSFRLADEGSYYQAGEQQVLFNIGDTPCSVFICYDLRFPELFRKVAKQVEVIFVIANWPASRQLHWQALLIARAIENQCFVVGVNRMGQDGTGIDYLGGSMVLNPLGETLCVMDENTEMQMVEIELAQVQQTRQQFPFLEDMKP